jgi:hypothetical protein
VSHIKGAFRMSVTVVNESHFFVKHASCDSHQSRRAHARVNPTIGRCACAGTHVIARRSRAPQTPVATTPEERKHSTTPHSITLQQFPKTTRHRPHRCLTPRHHTSTISHILQHADCSSSHLCQRLPPKPSRRRRAASYTRNFSPQFKHSTNCRNVQRTDIDQPPSSAVRPGDALGHPVSPSLHPTLSLDPANHPGLEAARRTLP